MCGGVCIDASQECGDGNDSVIPGPYIPPE